MKLYWSSRSPYVRKVMVVAHEAGVAARIQREAVVVSAYRINEDMLALNPLGKIPTLVLADGSALYDSRVICEYLDGLRAAGEQRLFPVEGAARMQALRWQALGDGVMDLLLMRLSEERTRAAEQRSEVLLEAIATKLGAALQALETQAAALSAAPFCIGQVAIGSALSYLDFRFGEDAWRQARERLADWHQGFEARPSVCATAHVDA